MLPATSLADIQALAGRELSALQPLQGGKVSPALRVDFVEGLPLVAKVSDGSLDLRIEAYMLRYLQQHSPLPVPGVIAARANLLLMRYIPGHHQLERSSLRHMGRLVAQCHQVRGEYFGLERDTVIGPFHQPNTASRLWIPFFREQRLLYMTRLARESGELPPTLEQRLHRLAERLPDWLCEPPYPALIHGDIWRNNVIARDGQIVGVIDPAIYYSHHETELAYMQLFDGFGADWLAAYQEVMPLDKAYFTVRRHIYSLYPLLVHLVYFGGKYLAPLQATLARIGL